MSSINVKFPIPFWISANPYASNFLSCKHHYNEKILTYILASHFQLVPLFNLLWPTYTLQMSLLVRLVVVVVVELALLLAILAILLSEVGGGDCIEAVSSH